MLEAEGIGDADPEVPSSASKKRHRRYCCVVGCHEQEGLTPNIRFYRFPSRPHEAERRARWITAVRRAGDSQQTLWFGVHMTMVTILPLILSGGHMSIGALQKTIVDQKFCEVPLDWIQRWGSRGALFGAWLGAIALVLDWDRPWQRWPTPCIVSSLLFRGPALMVASCILASQ
nr:uncharacterized protein LOC126533148 isoform X2 [Dermacentor andersoni]